MATATDEIYVKIITETQQSIQNIGNMIAKMAAAYVSFQAFSKLIKSSVKEYIEAEQAQTKLAMALKITGQYSLGAVSNLKAMSTAIQNTSIFSEEAAMEASGLLMQIGNLTTQGIEKAIPALADYASTMGVDLTTAAEQFASAIAGGRNAFQKYGITLDDTMSASEKFDKIMAGLNSKFRGMSEELAKTTGGQLVILANQWNEVKESIGGVIAQFANPILSDLNAKLKGFQLLGTSLSDFNSRSSIMGALDVLTKYKEVLDKQIDVGKNGNILQRMFSDVAGDQANLLKVVGMISDLNMLLKTTKDVSGDAAGNVNMLADSLGRVAMVSAPSGSLGNPSWANEQYQPGQFSSLPGGMGGAGNGNPIWQSTGQAQAANGWKEVADWLKKCNEEEARLKANTAEYYSIMQGVLGTARGIADSLVAGDISGAMKKMAAAALDALTNQALLAAATAAATGNYLLMTFWLGVAGATVIGSSYLAASGNPRPGPTSGGAPEMPYLSRAGSMGGTTVIVQGSVWSERDLGSAVAASLGRW